jgi:hypothetical protein
MLDGTKIALFLTVWIGFNSCEMHYTDDYFRNSDAKLCDKLWERQYIVNDELCTHQLTFEIISGRRKGTETFIYQQIDAYGNWKLPHTKQSFYFDWKWADDAYEGIMIDYGIDILYLDNAWVRDYYLSGYLEGEEVTFRAN